MEAIVAVFAVAAIIAIAAVAAIAPVAAAAAAAKFNRGGPRTPEGFAGGWTRYLPACAAGPPGERRGRCRGLTTGAMPSIEDDSPISWAPCCGALGVPPPVY